MNWFSTLSLRERTIVLTCTSLVVGALAITRGVPAYQVWVQGLLDRQAIGAQSLARVQADIAHAALLRDSVKRWRQRLASVQARTYSTLDALQAAAIATLSTTADSGGISLESVRAEAYTAEATRVCLASTCLRAIAIRATTRGSTEETLAFVMALRTRGIAVSEVSMQPQTMGITRVHVARLETSFTIRVIGSIDATGLRHRAVR